MLTFQAPGRGASQHALPQCALIIPACTACQCMCACVCVWPIVIGMQIFGATRAHRHINSFQLGALSAQAQGRSSHRYLCRLVLGDLVCAMFGRARINRMDWPPSPLVRLNNRIGSFNMNTFGDGRSNCYLHVNRMK